MPGTDLRGRLDRAVGAAGGESSDYDLNRGVSVPEGRRLKAAGVLVAVDPVTERVILTKRASHLSQHPGQIAFPGGKAEPSDPDVVATALREAREEVGLPEGGAEVLGCLPPHETVTGYSMVPVLAVLTGPFDPVPEDGEVAEIFSVPLSHVTSPGNFRQESRSWRGARRSYWVVPWGPYYIWGATAMVLRRLSKAMA